MDTRDIDIFLRAKKQRRNNTKIAIGIIIVGLSYWLLLLSGYDPGLRLEVNFFAQFALFFSVVYLAISYSNNKNVITHDHLLDIIERQLQSDPEALIYISEKHKQ